MIGIRLSEHGPAGADALVPLLADPSYEVRTLASYAIDHFEALDPRHLPALIAAHRRGLGVAKAIARTGSDDALRYLEAGWAVGDDDSATTRRALPLMGRRAEPFLMRGLERCRQGCSPDEAQSLIYALNGIARIDQLSEQASEQAKSVIRDVAAADSTEPELRRKMEDMLIGYAGPEALPIIVRRLKAARGAKDEDWIATDLLSKLGTADASGGPLILHYLSRPELRGARLEAVNAAWSSGYRPALPVLRSLLAEADRDWLLAYQALSVLAELGGREARPDIARLARKHWYRPVRNSARRALSRLDGGKFELPELGAEDERGGYAGDLNFAADVQAERDCRFDRAVGTLRFGRDVPVRSESPRHGAIRVALGPPSSDALTALGKAPELPPEGAVTLDWRRGADRILGIDGGAYKGGLFSLDPKGGLRRILSGDVLAAFVLADSLFVVIGDGSYRLKDADLWQFEAEGPLAVVAGPLRLPASPTGYALAGDRTLLIRTERGDLGLTPEGKFLPPRICPGAAPER